MSTRHTESVVNGNVVARYGKRGKLGGAELSRQKLYVTAGAMRSLVRNDDTKQVVEESDLDNARRVGTMHASRHTAIITIEYAATSAA